MLVHKYDYPILSRTTTNGQRFYTASGFSSPPVASVTTVLDKTADKTHLIAWRKRVGEQEASRISTESAGLGTKVHNSLEKYILEEENWEIKGNNFVSILAKKMVEVMIEGGLTHVDELWGTEVGVIAQGLYAGTTDAVGVFEGKQSIIDFKTAKKIKKREWIEDYFCQGCAYSLAHNEMMGTEIEQIVILMVDREAQFEKFIINGDEYKEYCDKWGDRLAQYYNC